MKQAFTLVEVLLTLVIIGVIAAITIPTLINYLNDIEYKSMWKKDFSTLNQAVSYLKVNYLSLKGVCGSWDNTCFANRLAERLNTTKICPKGSANGDCWHPNDASTHMFNGDSISWWPADAAGMVLADGTTISLTYVSEECDYTALTSAALPICAYAYIDVNGPKKPNVLGRDIFATWIQEDRLAPFGVNGDSYAGMCGKFYSGWSCSSEYLYGD